MKSVCVYCASASGVRPEYEAAAHELGTKLAKRKLTLIYGGASVGLMGTVANAALKAQGMVIGVLPTRLQAREIAHLSLSTLHIVDTMHERKQKMADLSDGFLALPGGFGTLEELFEIVTWSQIGVHQKPLVLVNINGYYDYLLKFLDHAVQEGILRPHNRVMLRHGNTVDEALNLLTGA